MSTSQRAVIFCGWGVKAGMVRVCGWQVELCDPLVTRGPYLSALAVVLPIIRCYINIQITLTLTDRQLSLTVIVTHDWLSIKDGPPTSSIQKHAFFGFCSCDLDIDPITLLYDLDLDILKIYKCIKPKTGLPKSGLSKLRAQTGYNDILFAPVTLTW